MIIYYNKQTMKQAQTQSEDTLPMADELMADYKHYAGNQQDKSLELIQEVGEIPYLKRYALDENGNRYRHYLGTKDEDGIYQPDLEKINSDELLKAKEAKKTELKTAFREACEESVLYNGVNYHGGEDSAMKLDGKRRMVESAGGTSVDYFDVNDDVISHTLEEAMQVCLVIANDYETKLADYKAKCRLVDNATTVAEMEVTNG